MKAEALGLCLVLSTAGCASIPEDAPRELFAAQAALEKADAQDAEEVLPLTMSRAHTKFDEAVDLATEAEDGADTKPLAVAKASEARQLAERAIQLNADVRGWDEDMEGYLALKQRPAEAPVIADEGAEAFESADGSLPGSVTLPVAFFETAAVDPKAREGTVKSLINMLGDDERLAVRLIGHADFRGNDDVNKALAQRRAEAMAIELEDAGIPRDRIEVVSAGDANATETHDPGVLQLDRRVDVEIIGVAH